MCKIRPAKLSPKTHEEENIDKIFSYSFFPFHCLLLVIKISAPWNNVFPLSAILLFSLSYQSLRMVFPWGNRRSEKMTFLTSTSRESRLNRIRSIGPINRKWQSVFGELFLNKLEEPLQSLRVSE